MRIYVTVMDVIQFNDPVVVCHASKQALKNYRDIIQGFFVYFAQFFPPKGFSHEFE